MSVDGCRHQRLGMRHLFHTKYGAANLICDYETWHLGDCNIRAVWKDWVSASWVKLQTLQHALVSHDGVDDVDKVGALLLSYLGLRHAKCWISLATVGPPPRHGARPNSVGRREVALLGGNSDTTKEIRRRSLDIPLGAASLRGVDELGVQRAGIPALSASAIVVLPLRSHYEKLLLFTK